ncbi:MAG TPA: PAS domain S-box protein [Chloroflexia bacterium]|nr:PAS domain S-box protein [Chloroflexia bacterium]
MMGKDNPHGTTGVARGEEPLLRQSPGGIITAWSSAAERLYGYSAAEAVGRPVGLFVPAACAGELPRLIQALAPGGGPCRTEMMQVTKAGRLIVVALTVEGVHNAAGTLRELTLAGREVPARPAAAATSYVTPPVSPTPEAARARRFEPPGSERRPAPTARPAARPARPPSEPWDEHAPRRNRDSARVVTALPRHLAGARTVAVMRDVGDQQRIEQELHASDQRYRLVFTHAPVPIWVYDRQTLQVVEVNQAAQAWYGYSPAECLALLISDLWAATDRPMLLDSLSGPDGGLVAHGSTHHLHKDGHLFAVTVATADLGLGDGREGILIAAPLLQ